MTTAPNKVKLIQTAVTLKPSQIKACKALADEKDISFSAIVRWALDDYFSTPSDSTCRNIQQPECSNEGATS